MGKRIYKYFGPDLAPVALNDAGATIKLSLPKDFNDPYELFLTVDASADPATLAAYQETIGAIPQLPTTCFSNSPAVAPMWAHYGQNVTGFALEFDEEAIEAAFPDTLIDDVSYQDAVDDGLTEMLYRAHVIGKPRYVYLLQRWTLSAAYFTKAACWAYEQERRMVLGGKVTETLGPALLLQIPKTAVTAFIAGARASQDLIDELSARAKEYGVPLYKLRIGRTMIAPYFVDEGEKSYIFDGEGIAPASYVCQSCLEPAGEGVEQCSWCQITEHDQEMAARNNPYRMMDRFGRLDAYLETMNAISAGRPNKPG